MDISKLYITWSDEHDLFFVESPDYPGLKADGATAEEAIDEFYICLEGWMEVMAEDAEQNR